MIFLGIFKLLHTEESGRLRKLQSQKGEMLRLEMQLLMRSRFNSFATHLLARVRWTQQATLNKAIFRIP